MSIATILIPHFVINFVSSPRKDSTMTCLYLWVSIHQSLSNLFLFEEIDLILVMLCMKSLFSILSVNWVKWIQLPAKMIVLHGYDAQTWYFPKNGR